MSDRRLDPEQVVRDWLAGAAPDRAPASLKAAVEEAASRPAGHARPWPRAGWQSFRFAGRVAAAVAILAIAGIGAYFYGNFRATSPAGPSEKPSATASATASASASATSAIAASPSQTTAPLQPTGTQLPGSNWQLVSGALPELVKPTWSQYERTVFALASGGFVAFVPSSGAGASPQPGAITTWETRVYQSADGIDWVQRASLPGATDTVTAVAQSGGTILAVGSTGETLSTTTAMAWTTTDLLTWRSAPLPAHHGAGAYSTALAVAGGPVGFLACGYTEFWTSPDGLFWTPIVTSGAPEFAWTDGLHAVPDGWVINGYHSDRAASWHSVDGVHWTQAWTGPAPQGLEFYALGPILKAGGGYISFGVAGMALYHAVVGADGKAAEIAVARPIGFGLDENAVAAIRKASFQPAVKDGKTVPVLLDLVVQFRIFDKRTAAPSAPEPADKPAETILPGPYSVQH